MKKFRIIYISCITIILFTVVFNFQVAKAKYSDLKIVDGALISSNVNSSEIVIPDNVIGIGPWAFANNTQITKVTIPDSVIMIDVAAFSGCTNLIEIDIPDTVTTIRHLAFTDTAWLKKQQNISPLVIVNGILIDGRSASGDITIPDTVDHINEDSFGGNAKIRSLDIPDSVTSIGASAFAGCYHLQKVIMADSITSIGAEAFYRCETLNSIRLSNSLTLINSGLFDGCKSLKSITLPQPVKEISPGAFRHCSKLSYVSVPDTLEAIYELAFGSCSNKLTFYGNNNSYASTYAVDNKFGYKTLAMSKTKATLSKGNSLQLNMNSYASCTWNSSNKKIATVSKSGKVVAIKKGKATVSATLYGKTFKCTITVK